jgi:formate hydrogenlyase subunit 3/multisubunit Na+/H+ antiporter MnhD subunit
MSVLLLGALAIPAGLATSLLATRRHGAFAIGLLAALACIVVAASIRAEDTVPLAGSIVGGSDGLRTIALAWSISTFLFGLMDGLLGDGPSVLGPSLMGLGVGALGLSVADAGIGFTLLTAGAVVAAVLPIVMVRGGPAAAPGLGLRSVRPVVAAGAITILAVAWGASPAGPFAAVGPLGEIDPALEASLGLALLAVAAAVVLRLGGIPFHAWSARFTEALPASAVPPLLAWGAAAFALVALGWVDLTITSTGASLGVERDVIAIVGIASIVLGGIAAIIHDDLEHVLAYSIVQDAGIALLAFATPGPEAVGAGRDWIIAAVAVKSGLAAWVLVTRATFRSHRRLDLHGWARQSPLLGVALVLVFAGAVGLPGMAAFDARATLIRLAVPGPVGVLVLATAFAPLVFLGRLLVTGTDAMAGAVRDALRARPRLHGGRADGWADDTSRVRVGVSLARANRFPLAAAAAVLVAIVGLSVAVGGLGSTAVGGSSGEVPGSSPAASATAP